MKGSYIFAWDNASSAYYYKFKIKNDIKFKTLIITSFNSPILKHEIPKPSHAKLELGLLSTDLANIALASPQDFL